MADGYSIETYKREDGWWSFRINGVESKYRSSNEAGLQRTINLLLQGQKPGTIVVKAIKGKAKAMSSDANTVDSTANVPHWAAGATVSERVAAFLKRGSLCAEKPSS